MATQTTADLSALVREIQRRHATFKMPPGTPEMPALDDPQFVEKINEQLARIIADDPQPLIVDEMEAAP